MTLKEIANEFAGTPHYESFMSMLARTATPTVATEAKPTSKSGRMVASKGKKRGGHLKYLTGTEATRIRSTYIGGIVTNSDTKAQYEITGANAIRFFYKYVGQADGDTNVPQAVRVAKSLLAHDKAFNSNVLTSNNAKWTFTKDGVSTRLDKKLEADDLFHPNWSAKRK